MVRAAAGQGQRQEQECAAQTARAAPWPPGTFLGNPQPCCARWELFSHPRGPWAPVSVAKCLWSSWSISPSPSCPELGGVWALGARCGVSRADRAEAEPAVPQVLHPALRPRAPSPCETRGCSHLCLLSARHTGQCRCPAGLMLASNETTCLPIRDSAFALLVSPTAVAQVPSSGASPGRCCSRHSQGRGVPIVVLPPSSRST